MNSYQRTEMDIPRKSASLVQSSLDTFRSVLLGLTSVYAFTQLFFIVVYGFMAYLLYKHDLLLSRILVGLLCVKYSGLLIHFCSLYRYKDIWTTNTKFLIYLKALYVLISAAVSIYLFCFALFEHTDTTIALYELAIGSILQIMGTVYLCMMAIQMPSSKQSYHLVPGYSFP